MSLQLVQVAQIAIDGVSIGAIYSLVALGLVLAYRATEVLNFAHGDLLTLAAFIAWALIEVAALPFWVAVGLTIAAVALVAWQLEQRVMRAIVGQPQFAGVMLTIALAFMIRGAVSMAFGPESRTYATPWTGATTRVGNLVIADLNLVIIVAALLITTALFQFLRRTSIGIAIQAASQNQLAAYLSGIRVKRLNSLVWALSGAMAAACGLLLAPIALVDLGLSFVLLKALAALVVGGFGSTTGAIVGGLVIGLVEQFSGVYGPDGFKNIAAYCVLIAVLVVAPRGILGDAHGRRV